MISILALLSQIFAFHHVVSKKNVKIANGQKLSKPKIESVLIKVTVSRIFLTIFSLYVTMT